MVASSDGESGTGTVAPEAAQPAQGEKARPRRRTRGPLPALANADDLDAIIVAGDVQRLIRKAGQIARRLREPLKTTQLRSVYAALRVIEADWPLGSSGAGERSQASQQALLRLKPKIAYQAARHRAGVGPLRAVLDQAIDRVAGKRARVARLVDFVGAILSYHRAAGGEEKDVFR